MVLFCHVQGAPLGRFTVPVLAASAPRTWRGASRCSASSPQSAADATVEGHVPLASILARYGRGERGGGEQVTLPNWGLPA